jgi:hypothetical protein
MGEPPKLDDPGLSGAPPARTPPAAASVRPGTGAHRQGTGSPPPSPRRTAARLHSRARSAVASAAPRGLDIVQVGVRQKRRDDRALGRAPLDCHSSTPAFSQLPFRRSVRLSPIRRSRNRVSHTWCTLPKTSLRAAGHTPSAPEAAGPLKWQEMLNSRNQVRLEHGSAVRALYPSHSPRRRQRPQSPSPRTGQGLVG